MDSFLVFIVWTWKNVTFDTFYKMHHISLNLRYHEIINIGKLVLRHIENAISTFLLSDNAFKILSAKIRLLLGNF